MPIPEGFYTVPPMAQFGAPRLAGRRHQGLDQYAPEGTASGLEMAATVIEKGYAPDRDLGFGHWVRYRHDDGHVLLEAHLMAASPLVEGRRYDVDTMIGRCGDTGNAIRVGPHVHLEVRNPKGLLVDPTRYLASIRPIEEQPDQSEEDEMSKPFMIHTVINKRPVWAVVTADLSSMVSLDDQDSANDVARRVTGPSAGVTPAEFARFQAAANA